MAKPTAEFRIEIDAPIDVVWSVMTDLPRYREWNPFVVAIDGELRPGNALGLHVRWIGERKETRTIEIVSRLEAPSGSATRRAAMEYRFTGWLARLWLVNGSRLQELEQAQGGSTRYHTIEEFSGLLTAGVPLGKVQKGFEAHARALKERAERVARESS
jgi:hypothetical protein